MLLQHCTADMEGKLKGMENYKTIDMDKKGIDTDKLIISDCHLQEDDKQDDMSEVETDKQVHLLYQAPYQPNTEYLKAIKAHLKASGAHSGAIGHRP